MQGTQQKTSPSPLTEKSDIKVSVIFITFNHEKYIAQAIESVLIQETNFNFEIVIGEDCSTDGTREIIIEYQKRYPDKIRLLLREHNIGGIANYIQTYYSCKGKYLAYLEGDDYWIDQRKLQKQVDFLDSNPEFSMCFTGGQTIDEDDVLLMENKVPEQYRRSLTQRDIVMGYVPPGMTVVERNYPLIFPNCIHQVVNVDFFEYAMLTEYGDAGYLPDVTACQRLHCGGIWSMKSENYYALHNLKIREALLEYFGKRYKDVLVPNVNYYYNKLIEECIKLKNWGMLFRTSFRYVKFLFAYKPDTFISGSIKTTYRAIAAPFR